MTSGDNCHAPGIHHSACWSFSCCYDDPLQEIKRETFHCGKTLGSAFYCQEMMSYHHPGPGVLFHDQALCCLSDLTLLHCHCNCLSSGCLFLYISCFLLFCFSPLQEICPPLHVVFIYSPESLNHELYPCSVLWEGHKWSQSAW